MLIDASHPEETRVAVVRGNRIEEYDFESQEKKQLRGNIYLAKVTRVEPSLQAAFVDYGGNRHGFLAFSEIHPDYYQIPMADRQALLDAEAEDARASREAEEAEDNVIEVSSDNEDEDVDNEAPKKKPRRRRSRKAKSADENTEENTEENTVSSENEIDDTSVDASEAGVKTEATSDTADVTEEVADEKPKRRSTRRKKAPVAKKADTKSEATEEPSEVEVEAKEESEPEKKPKRRTTRRKKASVKEASNNDADGEANSNDTDDDDSSTTMAAMVEMDTISEPLPEDADDDSNDEATEASDDTPVAEEKPKRRSTRRKAAPKKKTVEAEDKSEASTDDANDASEEVTSEESTTEEKPKPKKRAPRRKSRSKKAEADKETSDATETNDDDNEQTDDTAESIESIGKEDALEEVPVSPRRQRRHYKIQEVIKRRQVLLVQVVKEERGNKGAALTTYLSLAGRYSVLMPNTARGGGISRKITNAADRKRLKAVAAGLDVPEGMGVILRTAGASRTNAEVERDFDYLMRLWEQVRSLTLSSSAPCLVYEEGSLIKRSIRDLYDKDTGEVLVSGENGFNEAKDFMTMLMPNATKKVKLHRDKQAIFAKFGVETQLDKMVTPQVTLKSGGYLIIDQTEALVAVDVNSGRSTREHSIENTALQTNLEAAEEVARQLRLRDLAGLIVIDFIDMEEKRNNRAVEKKLKDCLKNDRARIQVGRISHFGLMEMSRQRMRASVLESTMDVCSLCSGTGHVRSDSAIALHVFRAIEEHVSRHNRYDAVIKTTPAIALHILNHKREALLELEKRYGLAILIEGSPDIKGQDFEIQKGELSTGEVKSTAVGFQDITTDTDDTSDEDEKQTRGRKRGRGRRKNQNDTEQDSSEEDNIETDVTSDDNDDEDKPRKKRRRGKRGGRRKNGEETSEGNASDDEASANLETNEQSQDEKPTKVEAETTEIETEASEEKPKSRSTTRRKAPVSKPTKIEASTPATETNSEEAEKPEEAKKPRRTTRRKKPEEETPSESEASGDTSSEPTAEQSDNLAKKTPEEGKKKKKGWWNRGGGFF